MLRISRRRPVRFLIQLPGLSLCPQCFLQLTIIASLFVLQDTVLAQVYGNSPPVATQVTNPIIVPEDTPNGTVIGTIEALDAEGQELIFTTDTKDTADLVSLSTPQTVTGSPLSKVVNIILMSELDRDFAPNERKLYFQISDGTNEIPVWISMFIQDVNDVAPQFVNLPYEVTIKENAIPGSVIFSGVTARDPDNGFSLSYSMESNAQAADAEYKTTFGIKRVGGNITLNRPLDYEKHSYYQFTIKAEDEGGLTADPASFVVYVLDVQDSPPTFINLPYSEQIGEDTPVGQPIQQVVALDGDQGIPNNITYSFQSGDFENFDIDPITGVITISTSLDRDSELMRDKGGVYAMIVQAEEVVPPGQINAGDTTATTLVTFTVRDVNDNGPLFGQQNYTATILENMQVGVPVGFQGPIMQVSDVDQGTNSHFYLTLEKDGKPYYDFAPQPQDIYSESSVVIRVNNSEVLDYEKNTTIVFQVVAREIDTNEQRSSTATVTIHIEDMNDNAPNFTQALLVLNVPESTPVNTPVATYIAQDEDSGVYGTIQYSIRGGNGRFQMDPSSGVLSVVGELDREENQNYYLTVEARDGGGLRTPVEVTVNVMDANDNKPVFRRDDYEGIVREEADSFARPVIVEAVDGDAVNTPNSQVSYQLVRTPPGLESNFTVDATTGEVSLTRPLDYEHLDPSLQGKVTLVIEASDAGVPSQSSEVMVNITVEDENDFTPEFTSSEYTATIPENAIEGYVVKTVSAIDLDGTSPNNDFIYRIESGAVDKFRIDFKTGDIQVEKGAELDRETRDEYTLTLSAIDRGTPPRTGYSTLKISLSDVNDETPQFNPPTRSVTVNENTSVNSSVMHFSADDPDDNENLVYSIGKVSAFNSNRPDEALDVVATEINEYFAVDASSGQVSIKNPLDRETTDRVVLDIVVMDTNAVVGQQTATGTLSVSIQDYNDEAPRFIPSDHYDVNVSEADGVQSIVLQVSATDDDFGQTISYSIGNADVDAFVISNDGTVRLKSELDRESREQIEFNVIARDSGSPALVSTATVTVRVLDDNDNKPVFQPYETSFRVSEDVSPGYVVTTFSAKDNDTGDFAHIVYSLSGTDNGDGSFVINSTTGELTVGKSLDRESKASFNFEVVASDSPNNPDEGKTERTNSITITILDVDDNPPVFTQLIPPNPFTVESSPVDQTIATVVAVDSDDQQTDNGRVIYELTSDTNATLPNGSPLFKIDSNSGIISTARTLRGYAGQYYITVMATNQARKYTPTRTIDIAVRDVNDDVPRFTKPSSDNAIAYVLENSDIGTSVFDLEAVDNDKGPNGEIVYTIVPLPNSDRDGSGKFAVNPTTGLISTTSADLNAESQEKYELKILATDQGYPDQYSTPLTVVIVVLDKNDHLPEFDGFASPHPLSMAENTPDACVSVDLAVDKDLNTTYTSICYYLIGSSLMNTFVLDVTTGQLCLNRSLDRETTPYVNVVVQALEDCYRSDIETEEIFPLTNGELYPAMFRPTYPDRIWIEIKVLDLNDNAPKFKSKELSLGVTRVTQFGRFILDLRGDVTDDDSNRWGVDKFVATSPFQANPKALQEELDELQVTEPFKLFPNGSVKTNMYFKPQMSGYFTVDLRVVDKGGLFDTAKLRISLINDDQRLIIVFRRSIDSVGPIKDEVVSRLSAKVGYRIVVDSIQTHETSTGQADPAKTDMYIHGEDFETNEVIPAARLLSLIDQKNALLVDLLNDYNVVEMIPVTSDDLDDGMEDKLKMALILVAGVFGSVCIILAVILFSVHRRYERKLKAATAMAYVNSGVEPNNPNMYISDIPGANIHSYENANPIFMEKILLESREEGLNIMRENKNDDDEENHCAEEQEVILEIGHTNPGLFNQEREGNAGVGGYHQRTPDGASTLPTLYAMDQHQRYLEAVIGEHKVKVENRREALVVDVDSDDEAENVIDNGCNGVSGSGKFHEDNYNDDNNDDWEDEDDEKRKYSDEDVDIYNDDEDLKTYETSRRDSGIEEKSEQGGLLDGKGNVSLFDPLTYERRNDSFNKAVDKSSSCILGDNRNGLHPKLSLSTSSDTAKAIEDLIRNQPNPTATLNASTPNGYIHNNSTSKGTNDAAEMNNPKSVKSFIESSGGVRVLPPEALLNGNFKTDSIAGMANHLDSFDDDKLIAGEKRGGARDNGRVPPDPLPRGVSPSVKYVRSMKAPDSKSNTNTGESDLESFTEMTDL